MSRLNQDLHSLQRIIAEGGKDPRSPTERLEARVKETRQRLAVQIQALIDNNEITPEDSVAKLLSLLHGQV